ncbi:hypothetical protein ACQR16_29595 [Bradyrhizobium oligotrophicum]|uniref:hypothetical protein n=1 Tax=Bradyrhizobium oligotrophicum TaxID=44255 RepID=UPI003EBEA7A9
MDLSGGACTESPTAGQPAPSSERAKAHRKSVATARRAALQRKHARAAKRRAAAQGVAKPAEKPIDRPRDKPARDQAPPAAAASAPQSKPPVAAKEPPPNPGTVQKDVTIAAVTVAAELAERMTALRVPEGPADSRLVAVLLARPTVRGLADLSGKVIAIDERYAKSNAKITTAMNAAGASEVLLLEGQATAITRLSNGEVSAAVVALASPEAAEAFPKIAGFNRFTVVLKP